MNNDAQENVFKCLEDISDRERKSKSKSRRWERSAWKIGCEVQMLSLGHTHMHIHPRYIFGRFKAHCHVDGRRFSVVDSEISGMLLCGCWGVSVRLPGCLESFLVRCYVAATEFWDTILKVIAHVCATDMIMHNLMLPTIKSRSQRACFAFHCAAFP